MDIDKELRELYKKYKRSTKAAYKRNYPLFVYLLITTTAFDINEQSLKYKHFLPKHDRLQRYLACCKALLEYQYDYEYILADLKLKLLNQDQSYFKKLANPEEILEAQNKLNRLLKEFRFQVIIPAEELKEDQKRRFNFLKKSDLLESDYIIHEDNHDYHFSKNQDSYLFSTMTGQSDPKKRNIDPRVTNILNRFFSADNYFEQGLQLSNEGFGKIQVIDDASQVATSMVINKFVRVNYWILDKWTIQMLEEMIHLFLYYTVILDINVQLETGLKYQPKFFHASGPSDAVDKYAKYFLGEKCNVYTTTDLLKKLHAMVLDYDNKRFKWVSLRTAVNRKGYNL
jgi:hypothetical protein